LAAAAAGDGAGAGGVAAVTERWGGGDAGAAAAGADGFAGGSGVMMLTGGVEAEVGNSALVGLPVGADDGSAATRPAPFCPGAVHEDA